MTFFITTFILSGVGIAAILSRQALKIRKLSDRKLKSKVLLNADFFKKILEYYFVPIYNIESPRNFKNFATLAQWQSNGFVNRRLSVQIRRVAPRLDFPIFDQRID